MQTGRTALLALIAVGMVAADLALAAVVLGGHPASVVIDEWWAKLGWLVIADAPYFAVLFTCAALGRRFPASCWILLVATCAAAAISLWLRFYHYQIVQQAYAAKQAGITYMNCGPPGRLVALVLDYGLFGIASCVAAIAAVGEHILRPMPPENKSPPHNGSKFASG